MRPESAQILPPYMIPTERVPQRPRTSQPKRTPRTPREHIPPLSARGIPPHEKSESANIFQRPVGDDPRMGEGEQQQDDDRRILKSAPGYANFPCFCTRNLLAKPPSCC